MKTTSIAVTVTVLFVTLSGSTHAAAPENAALGDPPLLCETAIQTQRPAEAPARSAVCFSSRWIHPQNASDPWDTFQVASAFQATDFVWVYSLDPQAVARMKTYGGKVLLAINSLVPDEPGGNERLRGRIMDLDGNRVTAPWMRGWKGSDWGCANSPEYRASYLAYANRAVDAGADALQMDDPTMNVAAVAWGGCFCEHCTAGFRQYLAGRATAADWTEWGVKEPEQFDYRAYLKSRGAPVGDGFRSYEGGSLKTRFAEFQAESVRAFYRDQRARIDEHAGRHVAFSSNNYAGRWQFPYDLFEMGMAELPERDANPKTLYERFADAAGRGKSQIFTLVPSAADGSEVALSRRVIATAYACGGQVIVPWDVYTGSGQPRYFGKPEDYADLYAFARAHADLLDPYEEAAMLVPGVASGPQPPMSLENAADVAAVARVIPAKPEAPVVIHLVDWRPEPEAVTLKLVTRRFVRQGGLQATLLQPGKPPARLDCRVADAGTLITVPPLGPWGMVVVSADE